MSLGPFLGFRQVLSLTEAKRTVVGCSVALRHTSNWNQLPSCLVFISLPRMAKVAESVTFLSVLKGYKGKSCRKDHSGSSLSTSAQPPALSPPPFVKRIGTKLWPFSLHGGSKEHPVFFHRNESLPSTKPTSKVRDP